MKWHEGVITPVRFYYETGRLNYIEVIPNMIIPLYTVNRGILSILNMINDFPNIHLGNPFNPIHDNHTSNSHLGNAVYPKHD